ncbi:MAG TPA: substrate-binding domain-containing protein, partial [Cyclobacteriaceae bacterium]|nr:substrate-binding domain-containing protein [Cyclobacteriaceae bacterium]
MTESRPLIAGKLLIVTIASVLSFGCSKKGKTGENSTQAVEGTISLSGAFALYPLANKWAEEFRKSNPGIRFNISAGGAGKGMADALAGAVDLGMLSRDIKDEEVAKGAWYISVTKDAVIPTVNSNNPVWNDLRQQGLSQDEFRKIFVTGEIKTWGEAVHTGVNENITVYTRSDAAGAAATWAKYVGGKEQDELNGIGVFGDPGLAEAIKNDRNGIGYNNIIFVYALDNKVKYPGIEVVPLDVNGDGLLTDDEIYYDSLDELIRAIGDGRFPAPPARELYFVSQGKPENQIVKTFLRWVLTEGQQYV